MLPNDVDVTTTYGTKAMLPNGKSDIKWEDLYDHRTYKLTYLIAKHY